VPKISKDTYIASDPNEGKNIFLNLDITFHNAPCFMIDIELRSSIKVVGQHELNEYLVRRRLGKDGEPLD